MAHPATPHANPFPDHVVDTLLHALASEIGSARLRQCRFNDQHSNDLLALDFDDGRTLVVKRGRHPWSSARFAASRRAAALLAEHDVVVPRPLPLPDTLDNVPLEAYWRIDLPTLAEVWPRLDDSQRERAIRSWSALARRIHQIPLDRFGGLADDDHAPTVGAFLTRDLGERLRPGVIAEWPDALPALDRLLQHLDDLSASWEYTPARLAHNDLHMGNVLCRVDGEKVRCVGMLDLEAAMAAPPEADLACFQTLHGPLFMQPLETRWCTLFLTAYEAAPRPALLAAFRVWHLLNFGFGDALNGFDEQAAIVALAATAEAETLEQRRVAA